MLACEYRERFFFLWVVSMGAMAAEDKEEREWFCEGYSGGGGWMGLGLRS